MSLTTRATAWACVLACACACGGASDERRATPRTHSAEAAMSIEPARNEQPPPEPERPPVVDARPRSPMPESVRELTASTNAFAIDLYQRVRREPGNLVFSPASISTAMAMTYAGARGETALEMKRALHLERDATDETLHESFGYWLTTWNSSERRPYQLRVANRLFGERTATFEPTYLALTRDHYLAALEPVDFRNDAETARIGINDWVASATENLIRDILPEGTVDASTPIVLVNAVYFKGTWETPFEPHRTTGSRFWIDGTTASSTPTMFQQDHFKYGHHRDGLSVLEMPYRGGDFAMSFLLPDDRDGLPALEAQLDPIKLAHWLGAATTQEVTVELPKFRLAPDPMALSTQLRAMGMHRAFDPERADFTGIARSSDPWFIANVVHKAFLEVDEQGTEAAAATAIALGAGGVPAEPARFVADHPFLFVLRDTNTGAILFMGRVTNPRS